MDVLAVGKIDCIVICYSLGFLMDEESSFVHLTANFVRFYDAIWLFAFKVLNILIFEVEVESKMMSTGFYIF